ncbi:hypothetical protein FHS27_001402 [Rhodopirellula rubra]|uniref:Uncharacterized protein n=1 Tax=Aporhodopirellula rubra TaxID=980271 RepID=A0A7W5H4X1_9BACT|nr:hypothetical protein [Aporhodopirellula rubra]
MNTHGGPFSLRGLTYLPWNALASNLVARAHMRRVDLPNPEPRSTNRRSVSHPSTSAAGTTLNRETACGHNATYARNLFTN